MIKYPVRVEGESFYVQIIDVSDRVIAANLIREDAEEIVAKLNASPRVRPRKPKIEDQLRDSDVLAKEVGRTDILYGPHDSLPQCGEHVSRLKRSPVAK